MAIILDEFMQDFTPDERARVAARTAELVEEELTLRDPRQAIIRHGAGHITDPIIDQSIQCDDETGVSGSKT